MKMIKLRRKASIGSNRYFNADASLNSFGCITKEKIVLWFVMKIAKELEAKGIFGKTEVHIIKWNF